jgi:urease accessory protein
VRDWSEAKIESGEVAEQIQELQVDSGGALEWLPQETIAFDGACAVLKTRIHLSPNASACAWDILCLGRPGSAEPFERGRVQQRLELWRGGQPVLLERGDFSSASGVMTQRWGLASQAVVGTFVWACSSIDGREARRSGGEEDDLLQRVRESMQATGREQVSVSWMRDCIVLRYLGPSTERAKQLFTQAWMVLRPALFQREPCVPRIWAT